MSMEIHGKDTRELLRDPATREALERLIDGQYPEVAFVTGAGKRVTLRRIEAYTRTPREEKKF